MHIPRRTLGSTGEEVTMIGLGGEGVLRTFGYDREAYSLINQAIDLGITYFESARAYSGSESYYGRALGERRKSIFLTSKSHARDAVGARAHLEETLKNMRTDYLDLWQVHDVRTEEDIQEIFGPSGAIEAFVKALEDGLVRYIGVTGHHHPPIIARCIELFPFDTVLMPVNAAEHAYKSFLTTVLPLARDREMGIIAMKVYLRGFAQQIPWFESLEPFLHFALSHPVSTCVIGCDSVAQLEQNVRFAQSFRPWTDDEMEAFEERVHAFARFLMYYKP